MSPRTQVLALLVLMSLARPASAQTMNFSVYNDAYIDYGTVFLYGSAFDNSSGCSHGNYSTTARIYSPSYRTNASQQSGLASSTSLSFDAEFGNYTVVTQGTYLCNCSHMTAGFGGGSVLPIPQPPSPPQIQYQSDTGTYDYVVNGVVSRFKSIWWYVSRQDGGQWTYGGTISEDWSGWNNPCNIPLGNLSGTMALNSSKQFYDSYYIPKYYACDLGCYAHASQDYRLSTYNSGNTTVKSHPVLFACASIDVL